MSALGEDDMAVSFRNALLRMFRGSQYSAHCAVRRTRRTLRAESLEMRAMLTTFFVDAGADEGGDGSWENPFNTIQLGIDAASNNPGDDTVKIHPGTYHETLQISDTSGALVLTSVSGDRDSVVIHNNTPANSIDRVNSANTIEIVGSLDVTISHLTVQAGDGESQGGARGGARGIWFRDSIFADGVRGDLRLEHVIVQAHDMGGVVAERTGNLVVVDSVAANNNNGVFTSQVGKVRLEHVTAVNNLRDGAQINGATSLRLQGGTYDDNVIHGLFVGNTETIQLENSTFNRNGDNGVDVRESKSVTAIDVEASDNGSLGQIDGFGVFANHGRIGAEFVSLIRVTASGNTGSGIGLRSVSETVRATDIAAHDNGFSGLTVANAPIIFNLTGGEFTHNTLHGVFLGGLASMTVNDVVAENNGSADNQAGGGGGGIRVQSDVAGATFRLNDSLLAGNVSPVGGGGLSVTGSVQTTLDQVSIIGNEATGSAAGGGVLIASRAADSVIRRSTIAGNSAQSGGGGGLHVAGSVRVENSTISGNSTAGSGGGIAVRGNGSGTVRLHHVTLTDNSANQSGGGVHRAEDADAVVVANSIIAVNQADVGGPDYSGAFNSLGSNLIGDRTGADVVDAIFDQIGTSENPIDPLLGPLQDNGGSTWTHALLPGSPAIDAVDPRSNVVLDHDQRNVARPLGTAPDIGAFEFEPEPNTPPVADDKEITVPSGTSYQGQLTGSDADGDPLTFQLVSGPENHFAFRFSSNGSFSYQPKEGFVGSDSFTFRTHDGQDYSEVATVSITVIQVNRPPVANDDFYSTLQDTPLVVVVEAGPGTLDQVNERDTGLHQFNTASLDLQQQLVAGQSGVLHSVDLFVGQFSDVGRVLDFFVHLGEAPQTDSPAFRTEYTIQAEDIGNWITLDVSSANIQLEAGDLFTIGSFKNDSPSLFLLATNSDLANGDNYPAGSLWVNGSLHKTFGGNDYDLLFRTRMADSAVVGGVLANDTDPDGDTLTAHLVTQAQHGTVELSPNGAFTYVPNPGFSGEDWFTYLADDGNGGTDTATVFITVEFVNSPPEASDHHFIIPEDLPDGAWVGQVEASDPDGDPLTFAIVSGNESGTFAISDTGQITVADSSLLDFATTSSYQLVVEVSDGQLTATSSVLIELTPVEQTISVVIDIRPGDPENRIDPTKNQPIDVVIFSSAGLDASLIDIDSLRLGATGTEDSLRRQGRHQLPRVKWVDVNGNGLLDLVVTFDSGLMGLTEDDTEAILTGNLTDGRSIIGSNSVTVSSNKGRGNAGGNGKGAGSDNPNAGPKK
jgi:hypothetical protein